MKNLQLWKLCLQIYKKKSSKLKAKWNWNFHFLGLLCAPFCFWPTLCTARARKGMKIVKLCHPKFIWWKVRAILKKKNLFNRNFFFSEEYDELGRLQRTCNGEVTINKCEGLCNSQVQPSVITPTGFLKECYCCRETVLKDRLVKLTHCYDPDGARLTDNEMSTLDIRLKEPAECRCYKCGDFSR